MCTFARCVGCAETIVVDIDDHHQAGVMCHIDEFCHAIHPSFLDSVGGGVADMSHPCDRDADRFESGFRHSVESLLGSGFITPSFLVRATIVMGIHLVTEVPSDSHGHGELYRFVILRTCFFLLCLTGG